MSLVKSIQKGIALIEQGKREEADRYLRQLLTREDLKGSLRAKTCNWLAEAVDDIDDKINLYQAALDADLNNAHARQRLQDLMESSIGDPSLADPGLPDPPSRMANPSADWPMTLVNNDPTTDSERYTQGSSQISNPTMPPAGVPQSPAQSPAMPTQAGYGNPGTYPTQAVQPSPSPQQAPPRRPGTGPLGGGYNSAPPTPTPTPTPLPVIEARYPTVTILGGPNGPGTGFFLSQTGLIATTRFVVSAMETVLIELEQNNRVEGRVARAFPEYDLVLIESNVRVTQLLTPTSHTIIPDNTRINAYNHDGRVITGVRRATQSQQHSGWFPTTIPRAYDAGGNPILDDRNFLVGMLTRNANRSSPLLFGLHISLIFRLVERYAQEINSGTPRECCPTCGYLSQSVAMQGFYCEMCGAVLPSAQQMNRYPLPQMQLESIFGESRNRPCRFCGSRAGLYDHVCQRCGLDSRTSDGLPLDRGY